MTARLARPTARSSGAAAGPASAAGSSGAAAGTASAAAGSSGAAGPASAAAGSSKAAGSASAAGAASAAAGTSSPTAGTSSGVIKALQAALAAENAAIFGYGVAGAHLTGAQRAAAERDWVTHETARDTLTAMLMSLRSKPVPAAAAYELPFSVRGAAAAAALAALLEDRVTRAYLGLVALREPRLRAFGAWAVQSAALRATAWRGHTLAFPGLDIPTPRPALAGFPHGASPQSASPHGASPRSASSNGASPQSASVP